MYRLSLIISEIYNKYLPLAEKDGIILNLDFSDTTKEITDPERVKQYLDEHLNSTLKRSDKGEVTISVDRSAITITDSATTLSHTACTLLSNKYIDVTSRVGFGTTVKIFFQPRELATVEPTAKPPLKVEGVSIATSLDNPANQAPTLKSEVKVAAKQGKKKIGLGAQLKLKGKKSASKPESKITKSLPVQAKASTTKPTTKKLSNLKAKRLQAKTERQLAAAARKANKEVKRIAKKAQKASQQRQKTNRGTKQNNNSSQKISKSTKQTVNSKVKTTKKKVKKLELS